MSLNRAWGVSALVLAFCTAAAAAQEPAAEGPACGCASAACATGNCGWWGKCFCPKTVFTIEKPPHIKFCRVCPKPVCDRCELDGYGYYPTCWRPFAYPPNYAYCPAPPPGVLAGPPPPLIAGEPGPASPGGKPDEGLPPPKKSANPNPNR
jgi:hypothetical protein